MGEGFYLSTRQTMPHHPFLTTWTKNYYLPSSLILLSLLSETVFLNF
jgi:hypothetical protein